MREKEAKCKGEDEEEESEEEEEATVAGLAIDKGGGTALGLGERGEGGEAEEVRRSLRAPPGREGSILIFLDLISVLLRCFMALSAARTS